MKPKLSRMYLRHELLVAYREHRGLDVDTLLAQPIDAAAVKGAARAQRPRPSTVTCQSAVGGGAVLGAGAPCAR